VGFFDSEFPFLCVENREWRTWRTDVMRLIGAHGLAVDGTQVLFAGGTAPDRALLAGIGAGRLEDPTNCRLRLPLGEPVPSGAVMIGRGAILHVFVEKAWYQANLSAVRGRYSSTRHRQELEQCSPRAEPEVGFRRIRFVDRLRSIDVRSLPQGDIAFMATSTGAPTAEAPIVSLECTSETFVPAPDPRVRWLDQESDFDLVREMWEARSIRVSRADWEDWYRQG
jgi:hypothetical protein